MGRGRKGWGKNFSRVFMCGRCLSKFSGFLHELKHQQCSLGCSNIGCSLPMQVQPRCIRQVTCEDRDVFMLLYKELVKELEIGLQCTMVRLWKWLECRLAVFGQFCRSEQATWTVRTNSLPCCLSPSAWETVTRAACAWQWCCPASPHHPRHLWRCHRPIWQEKQEILQECPRLCCQPGGIRDEGATEIRAGLSAEFSKAAVAGQLPWSLATRHRIGTVCWASCTPVYSHWAPWKWFGKHHR